MAADVRRYLGARYSCPRRSGPRTPAQRWWQHRPAECGLQRPLLAAAGTAAAAGAGGGCVPAVPEGEAVLSLRSALLRPLMGSLQICAPQYKSVADILERVQHRANKVMKAALL